MRKRSKGKKAKPKKNKYNGNTDFSIKAPDE